MEALKTVDIDENNISEYKLYFAHQEFKGCKMGAITSLTGDDWNPSWPLCISGHIHEYQELQPNLIYAGTPIQHAYGDSPNKAIMILESELDSTLDKSWSKRRINLGLPKKIIVHIQAEDLLNYKLPENSFVKLVVTGESDKVRDILKLEKVKELLSSERIKLSIQEQKKKKNDLDIRDTLLTEVLSTQFVPFQDRLKKVLSGEKP
jgi:DNA repair exonuclease SbcCD nuclease subunit